MRGQPIYLLSGQHISLAFLLNLGSCQKRGFSDEGPAL